MAAAGRVKKMKSKGKRSRSRGYQVCCRRESAGRYDCSYSYSSSLSRLQSLSCWLAAGRCSL